MPGIVLDTGDILESKATKSLTLWTIEELDNKQCK